MGLYLSQIIIKPSPYFSTFLATRASHNYFAHFFFFLFFLLIDQPHSFYTHPLWYFYIQYTIQYFFSSRDKYFIGSSVDLH